MITRSCLVVLACLTGLVSAHAETTLKVDASITRMKADGRLQAILKKWGL